MDHDHGTTNTTTTNRCPMNMIFHFNHCERIMWSWWVASEIVGFTFSCLGLGVLSFALEAVKYWREVLIKKDVRRRAKMRKKNDAEVNGNQSQCCPTIEENVTQSTNYWQRITTSMHIIQMLLYTLQMTIAYIIMLAFMNFNYWMCLAMIGGLAIGYFCFGWIKQRY